MQGRDTMNKRSLVIGTIVAGLVAGGSQLIVKSAFADDSKAGEKTAGGKDGCGGKGGCEGKDGKCTDKAACKDKKHKGHKGKKHMHGEEHKDAAPATADEHK